jgi:archaellum component FlaC
MRYKEQSLNKIEQVNNRVKNIEFLVLRGQQNEAVQALEELKEKIEELRSLISIEHNDFETYGN